MHPQVDALVHAAAEKLRRQRPSLFTADEAVVAARAASDNGEAGGGDAVLAARVESLEREVRAGMASMRGDIAEMQSSVSAGMSALQSQLAAALKEAA